MLSRFRRFRSVRVAAGIIGALVALGASADPPRNAAGVTAAPELRPWPAAPLPKVRQMLGVRTPMRDGVHLVSDIWLPQGEGRYPVVLIRTPYERNGDYYVPDRILKLAHAWAAHGIGVVNQDVRGRGDSEGTFEFFHPEGPDGYDTIEWIARQPWSNGQVAMSDGSYKGTVQWLAAKELPPHLTCLFSQAPAADFFNETPYTGGIFHSAWNADWPVRVSGRISQNVVADSKLDLDAVLAHRPLITADLVRGREIAVMRKFLSHPTLDDWWKPIYYTQQDFGRVSVPAFHISGWFDGQLPGNGIYWRGMRSHSPARDRQYLMLGPWTHAETRSGGTDRIGDVERGKAAIVDIDALSLKWFKACFAGTTDQFEWPRARVFMTGVNRWMDFSDFTPPEAVERRLFLRSAGTANQTRGGGQLAWAPSRRAGSDSYTFDPLASAPRPIGVGEVAKQDSAGTREDVLVYTTDPLEAPLAVAGLVTLELHAATSARDTDFVAYLFDIDPAGNARRVVGKMAALRTRYREGFDRQVLMRPGVPARLELPFFDVGHVFLPGHRLRIEIASTAPGLHPNPNTGNDIATDTQYTIARQTILNGGKHPSALRLPVIPWE
jgi:putative CocE/NonD family hydrolase